jgi:hypothetical protein
LVYCQLVCLGDKPLESADQYFYFPSKHWRLQSFCNIIFVEDGRVI